MAPILLDQRKLANSWNLGYWLWDSRVSGMHYAWAALLALYMLIIDVFNPEGNCGSQSSCVCRANFLNLLMGLERVDVQPKWMVHKVWSPAFICGSFGVLAGALCISNRLAPWTDSGLIQHRMFYNARYFCTTNGFFCSLCRVLVASQRCVLCSLGIERLTSVLPP